MSSYEVNRLIYRMKMDDALAARFRDDREGLLSEVDLSDDERRALIDLDFDYLRSHGIVPNLLLRLTSIAKVPLDRLTASAPASTASVTTRTE